MPPMAVPEELQWIVDLISANGINILILVLSLIAAMFLMARRQEERSSVPPPREPAPRPPPEELGEMTSEELLTYDGTDTSKPLLMAIRRTVYDVSASPQFYGPGGPYGLFAGKDASRALAKMSFEPEHVTSDISGLSMSELEILQDWEERFRQKYIPVGRIVEKQSESTEKAEAERGSELAGKPAEAEEEESVAAE